MSISCPHCSATLKLKDNSFVGKRVPCPKCKKPFVVEEPPEDEFQFGGDDEFGDLAPEEEEEEEAPRSKGKSKSSSAGEKTAKGGKKKKKSKGGGGMAKIALIGGGVVLGLGLLGGIVYGAISLFSGAGSTSWVKWLPEETDIAIQVRVADSLNAPMFKPITNHPTLSKLINQPPLPANDGTNPAVAFLQGLNIQAKDIDTVTVGIINGLPMIEANNAGGQQAPQKFMAVIRLKTPVEESKLAQAPATVLAKEDYQGKSVYAIVGTTNPKTMLHAVDSKTYLVGSDAELKAAIDAKGTAPASKRFAFADDKSSFIVVAAPKDPSKLKALGITTLKTSSGATTDTGKIEGIYGISYGFTLGTDLQFEVRSSLSRSMAKSTADQLKKEMEAARPGLRTQISQLDQAPAIMMFVPIDLAMVKKTLGHLDTMLGSVQASSSGSTASAKMTLSGQFVEDAILAAQPAMPLLEAQLKKMEMEKASKSNSPATAMHGAPTLGNSAADITAYPGQVIDAGEKSKGRIGDLNDQHNSALEAEMQEGQPANAHAAPAPSPANAHAAPATPAPSPANAHAAPTPTTPPAATIPPATSPAVPMSAVPMPAAAVDPVLTAPAAGQQPAPGGARPADPTKSRSRRRTPVPGSP